MQFVEAFGKLGFRLPAQRTDWSAANEHGVCLSLWSKETDWRALVMDTREHAEPIEKWRAKPGSAKRIQHAQLALDEFDGWVDVMKIEGVPGKDMARLVLGGQRSAGVSAGVSPTWMMRVISGSKHRTSSFDEL